MTITEHLLMDELGEGSDYFEATHHDFLTAAANRTLNHDRLALWLAQDRIYAAHAYPRLIGQLITKIPFSTHHGISSPEERRNQRILALLSFSLDNVVKEANFFLTTSEKFGLNIQRWGERKETRDYTAEMARIGAFGTLWEGLVFLWAMEKVYLDAWNHVKEKSPSSSQADAVASFANNWSSPEFVGFVDKIAAEVNDYGFKAGSEECDQAERIWMRVLELEIGFWPNEGEEKDVSLRLQ